MTIPNAKHQGFKPNSVPRNTYVPRVEKKHSEFYSENSVPEWVLLNFYEAKKLADKGVTAKEYGRPDLKVATTTTQSDESIKDLTVEDELRLLQQFRPHAHIPGDHPTYTTQTPGRRARNVMETMQNTLDLHAKLRETELQTQLIPLIKGENPEERQICYDVMEYLGIPYCAVYTRQYFGSKAGYQKTKLLEDIREIAAEPEVGEIFTVGLDSTNLLEELPPIVTATASMQWIWETDFRNQTKSEAVRRLHEHSKAIENQLSTGQMLLANFADNKVVA